MDTTYTQDELRAYFEWQLEQINPMFGRKNKDVWAGQTVDTLMASPVAVRGAIATIERTDRRIRQAKEAGYPIDQMAPWEDPNWREKQAAAEKAEADRKAAIADQGPFVTGGQ